MLVVIIFLLFPLAVCESLLTDLQPPAWGEGIFGCADAGWVCRALRGYV